MNQLRNRNVFTTLCQLPAEQLDGIASSYGVPVQQQKTYDNRKDHI